MVYALLNQPLRGELTRREVDVKTHNDMINLDFNGDLFEGQKIGHYFRPKSHICRHYMVDVVVKELGFNCLVTIYEIDTPQPDGNVLDIENGQMVATSDFKKFCEIDMWGKYYFPVFSTEMNQWYYDDSGNMDYIQAMYEVMKFAVDLVLKEKIIVPY